MANLGAINQVYTGDLSAPGSSDRPSPAQMYAYLLSQGANPNEARMLTGAAASESLFNPNAVHDGGVGYGMFGHNGARLAAMKQFAQNANQPLSDWRTQSAFALNELRSRPEGHAVANAQTPEQLALAEMHYEQPEGYTAANPEAGRNFTGRLNTIRSFTSLDPNAAGASASGANPPVSPDQVAASASAAPPIAATPSVGAPGANPFAAVGNPAMNAALYQMLRQSSPSVSGQPASVPLVPYLAGQLVSPVRQAIGDGLSSLFDGDETGSSSGASSSPSSTPVPPPQVGLSAAPASALPIPPAARTQSPAVPSPGAPALPLFASGTTNFGQPQPVAPVSATVPAFTQPGLLQALAALRGSAGA